MVCFFDGIKIGDFIEWLGKRTKKDSYCALLQNWG